MRGVRGLLVRICIVQRENFKTYEDKPTLLYVLQDFSQSFADAFLARTGSLVTAARALYRMAYRPDSTFVTSENLNQIYGNTSTL